MKGLLLGQIYKKVEGGWEVLIIVVRIELELERERDPTFVPMHRRYFVGEYKSTSISKFYFFNIYS